ncbi:hypothetical protein ABN028_28145, partial [Actinopolymorpha sp. B17G11]
MADDPGHSAGLTDPDGLAGTGSLTDLHDPAPTVIVDDLHIIYRVLGATAGRGNAPAAFTRLLRREKSPAQRE